VTRARWLMGVLIGAAALIVAGESLATYLAERLVVGVVTVVVLMAVLAIGFASLAQARRYVARELSGLSADPPSGALYAARRAQLVLLRRRGVAPDLDLLADATAAEETERGYAGRYLVATTVLIGLVGTFGGLMETLARVAPLLKGDLSSGTAGPTGAFALIAGPLAGLHVTFGTSVVAILATLALALVQGDVTLHHQRLLALLEERTHHVLGPELWPADDSAGERTVRALLELRAFVAESLTTSAATSAERIAGIVRVEVKRATEAAARELRDAGATSRGTMTAAATEAREAIAAAAKASQEAAERAATASREAFEAAATATHAEMAAAIATLTSTTTRTSASIATSTEAAVRSLGELRASLSAQLEGASQALATAAAELRGTVNALSPALAELAPQLGALATEIALLAARADSPEQPNAVLDELVRLGEDVERLLASSQPPAAATEAEAREAGS
jgi:hypothetical protein